MRGRNCRGCRGCRGAGQIACAECEERGRVGSTRHARAALRRAPIDQPATFCDSWFIRGPIGAPIAPSFRRAIFVVRLGHHMDANRSTIAEDPLMVQLSPPGRVRFVGKYDGSLYWGHTPAHSPRVTPRLTPLESRNGSLRWSHATGRSARATRPLAAGRTLPFLPSRCEERGGASTRGPCGTWRRTRPVPNWSSISRLQRPGCTGHRDTGLPAGPWDTLGEPERAGGGGT